MWFRRPRFSVSPDLVAEVIFSLGLILFVRYVVLFFLVRWFG